MYLHTRDSVTGLCPGEVVQTVRERGLFASLATLVGKNVARKLLYRVGANGVEHMSAEELASSGGLSLRVAEGIVAARSLSAALEKLARPKVTNVERLLAAILQGLATLEHEVMLAVVLDSAHDVKAVVLLSRGGVSSTSVLARDVFVPLVRHAAHAFALVHNHPSGDPTPSLEDMALTTVVARAGAMVGIPLIDHLVVAKSGVVSFSERGMLPTADELDQVLRTEGLRGAS